MIVPTKNTRAGISPDKFFAKMVTRNNSNAIILIQGPTGSGKSYFAMSLAMGISRELSKIIGGKEDDYFPRDLSNQSVINISTVKDLMLRDNKQYSVLILDDISTSYGNRQWQQKSNNVLNSILTVFRPKNNVLILTMPSASMIDLTVRKLAHYLIECERNTKAFDRNVGVAKMFKLVPQRSGKIFAQYVTAGRTKMLRVVVPKPPEDVCNLYDGKRNAEFDKIMKRSLDEWDAFEAKENNRIFGKEAKKASQDTRLINIMALHEQGLKNIEISKIVDLTPARVGQLLKENK